MFKIFVPEASVITKKYDNCKQILIFACINFAKQLEQVYLEKEEISVVIYGRIFALLFTYDAPLFDTIFLKYSYSKQHNNFSRFTILPGHRYHINVTHAAKLCNLCKLFTVSVSSVVVLLR